MRTEYTFDELLAEHDYERPLALDGVPCHGGFVDGRYVSPRTLWRAPAIEAWQARLPAGELAAVLDPITARVPPHFPGVEQTKLLVRHGVTVPLVRILSIIALVEGFGGDVLRLVTLPPLGERVLDRSTAPRSRTWGRSSRLTRATRRAIGGCGSSRATSRSTARPSRRTSPRA